MADDSVIIKLFDFNVLTDAAAEAAAEADDDEEPLAGFTVQMFGIDAQGGQVAVEAIGFRPFFYAKVPDYWTSTNKMVFIEFIRRKLGRLGRALVDVRILSKGVLYGFDDNKNHKFVALTFTNLDAFNRAKNMWYSGSWESNDRRLTPGGLTVPGCGNTHLYEANIPPLIRFFHIHNISPSGWVRIPRKQAREVPHTDRRTTCAREFIIPSRYIEPLNNMEKNAPYLKMSFDIEASSSHGDFPVPIKTYKKLATNIVDMLEKAVPETDAECELLLRRSLQVAFGYADADDVLTNDVDQVFPQKPISRDAVQNQTNQLVSDVIGNNNAKDDGFFREAIVEEMFERKNAKTGKLGNDEAGNEEDTGEGSGGIELVIEEDAPGATEDVREVHSLFSTMYAKSKPSKTSKTINTTGNIVSLLRNKGLPRDARLTELITKLRRYFPKLEGDKVTFIGSTFMRQGTTEPYMNHCIVLDTCEMPDAGPNTNMNKPTDTRTVIETYGTEREVLLAWTRLMQVENPDMVMGYNIFGFDYEFMFRRAQELNCVEEFLKLSKNRNEICGTVSRGGTGAVDIDRSVTTLASGTYELAIIKMPGRLQVDMLGWFRKNDNLTSYKLDDVAGHFIGDDAKRCELQGEYTRVYTGNMLGLHVDTFVHFDEITHSTSAYNGGAKFRVTQLHADGFTVAGVAQPKGARVRWGLSKDDVTPKDIFRLTREGPQSRGIVAKYCIQDCNLVHYLLNKTDVPTSLIEMSRLCSVPMSFLIFRGQGIKLTSFVAKKCRDSGVLMPVVERGNADEAYEGAIVLPPKCGMYLKEAVGIGDFGSLYPSSMLSENLCPRSKVWTKTYDLEGTLMATTGIKSESGDDSFKYDNLPGRTYVDRGFDTYKWIKPRPTAAFVKVKTGYRVCRFVQPLPNGDGLSIMPSILKELLGARKATRKLIPQTDDEFMKNVLDKRQLAYKVTANSLYGQMGAKTSTFYEPDIAAATTSTGRMLLTYAKRVIEECYADQEVTMKDGRKLHVKADCVYGDTDSVFFKFNFVDVETGAKIEDRESLEYTIELSQTATALVTKFLKAPHDFEYEKTFMPFCLLAKKRYVAIKYEFDPNKGKRNEMGIVLKRRDNAPIVKDVYGGAIDILMKEQNISKARDFVVGAVEDLLGGKVDMSKLVISKSLRGFYANPQSIAHNVLASRIGERDPGNKPRPGDRIAYAYFMPPNKAALQKDRIELPQYIREKGLKIDYEYYIHKQLMNPISQLFGLVIDDLCAPSKLVPSNSNNFIANGKSAVITPTRRTPNETANTYRSTLEIMHKKIRTAQQTVGDDSKKFDERVSKARAVAVAEILFGELLRVHNRDAAGLQDIGGYFKPVSASSSSNTSPSPPKSSKSAKPKTQGEIVLAKVMANFTTSSPHKPPSPPNAKCKLKLKLPGSPPVSSSSSSSSSVASSSSSSSVASSSSSVASSPLSVNDTIVKMEKMQKTELMNMCQAQGLAKSGNKSVLIERLMRIK